MTAVCLWLYVTPQSQSCSFLGRIKPVQYARLSHNIDVDDEEVQEFSGSKLCQLLPPVAKAKPVVSDLVHGCQHAAVSLCWIAS